MAYTTSLLTMSALLVLGLVAQDLTSEQRNSLESTVRDAMRCADIPSLSLTLVSLNNRISYMKGFGSASKHGRAPDHRSMFCIGGATQAFTAVLLAQLLDRNQNITWDTPIKDIVGHQLQFNDNYLANNLNLKDILAMRSGLAGMDIIPWAQPFTAEELVSNLRYAPQVAGFREKFVYNEVLFSLLDEVINKLGGYSWNEAIRRHVLLALDMKSTTIIPEAGNPDLIAGAVRFNNTTYYLDSAVYSGLDLVAPAASLWTSAEDMSLWFRFLLTGRNVKNEQIIREEALQSIFSGVQPRGQEEDPVIQGYRQPHIQASYSRDLNSLGWINGYYRGYPFFSQDGSLPGYETLATVFPSQNVAVFVAFNGGNDQKRFAAKTLLNMLGADLLIQGNSWLSQDNVCSLIDNISKASSRSRKEDQFKHLYKTSYSTRPLEDYVGSFRNYPYGDVNVQFNASRDNRLILKYGVADYRLEPLSMNNTFQLSPDSRIPSYIVRHTWIAGTQRIIAVFSSDPHDSENRISAVKIYGFDKNYVPEFRTNAEPPHYDAYRCSASVLVLWKWPLFFLTVFGYIFNK